jgi:ribosome biogenesis GTPase / thiamine phosphate phosphatase
MSLKRWGWNAYFEALWNGVEREGVLPARVISQQRKFWRVAGEFGEVWAEASGVLRLAGDAGGDWPAVGDWVAAELPAAGENGTIREVLGRKSRFARKVPGKRIEEQVIAANVDTALLVSSMDGDFNPRRIERYLAQCWESGARPVVVLNKADACEEAARFVEQIEGSAAGTSVCVVSAKTGHGFTELEQYLAAGETMVLLGSSGVGKSTIVNRLMGRAIQETQEVRESDSKGRHTTTARELFSLPGGALLIDTPGLRELQLWNAEEALQQTFADIEELASKCRFGNCTHGSEPGCAVQAAITGGALEAARLENQKKLEREEKFQQMKIDPDLRQEEKERVRKLHKEVRKIYRGPKHQ